MPRFFSDLPVFQDMSGSWLTAGICILLGLVGFSMGLSGTVVENLEDDWLSGIVLPFALWRAVCSRALYGLLSPLTVGEAVTVGAGFGWYTLAPSMITEAGHAVAGAISFMHNVIRRNTWYHHHSTTAAQKIGLWLEATAFQRLRDGCHVPIVKRSCNQENFGVLILHRRYVHRRT